MNQFHWIVTHEGLERVVCVRWEEHDNKCKILAVLDGRFEIKDEIDLKPIETEVAYRASKGVV